MSSVSSPLGTYFQQAFNPPAVDQTIRTQRLQTAGQQTSAPIDTVTISGFVSQPRSTRSVSSAPQPSAGTASAANPGTPAPGVSSGAASASSTQLTNFFTSSTATQQQQLAQLDQVLQQLGVDPNSIPTSEQETMLLYLNHPPVLAQFVQSLGEVVPTLPPQAPGSTPTNQQPKPPQSPADATPPVAETRAARTGNAAVTTTVSNTLSTDGDAFVIPFQELQQSLEAIGADPFGTASSPPQAFPAAAGIASQGQSLNVVA